MVQRCCVPFCKSKVGDTDRLGIKLKFHRMPHTVERFTEWALKITDNQRLKPFLSTGSRVCSRHFLKEDYLDKSPLGNNPLKKEIFPSIFHWNSPSFNSEISSTMLDDSEQDKEKDLKIEDLKRQAAEVAAELMDSSGVEMQGIGGGGGNWHTEVIRKNTVIQQLLTRILELEDEEKGMKKRIAELRAMNECYEHQIKLLTERNNKLELTLKAKGKVTKDGEGQESLRPLKHTIPDSQDSDENPSEKKVKLDK